MPLYRTNSDRGLWRKYKRENPPQHFHKACYIEKNKHQPQVTYSQLDLASEGRQSALSYPRSRAMSEGGRDHERPITAAGSLYSQESSFDSRSLGRDSALGPYMKASTNTTTMEDRPNPFTSGSAADDVVQMFLMNMGGLNLGPSSRTAINNADVPYADQDDADEAHVTKTVMAQYLTDTIDHSQPVTVEAAPKLNKYLKPENRWSKPALPNVVATDVVQTYEAPQMHHAEVVHVRQDSTSSDGGSITSDDHEKTMDGPQQFNASMFTHANGSMLQDDFGHHNLPLTRKRSMSKPTDLDEILRMQEENGEQGFQEVFDNDPFFQQPPPELPMRTSSRGNMYNEAPTNGSNAIYENFNTSMMETTQEIDIDAALGYDIENIEWPQTSEPPPMVPVVDNDFIAEGEPPIFSYEEKPVKKSKLNIFGIGKKKSKHDEVSYYIEEPQPEPDQEEEAPAAKSSLFKFKGAKKSQKTDEDNGHGDHVPQQLDQQQQPTEVKRSFFKMKGSKKSSNKDLNKSNPEINEHMDESFHSQNHEKDKPSLFKFKNAKKNANNENNGGHDDHHSASNEKPSLFKFRNTKKSESHDSPPEDYSSHDEQHHISLNTSNEKPSLFKLKGSKKSNKETAERETSDYSSHDEHHQVKTPTEKPRLFKFKGSKKAANEQPTEVISNNPDDYPLPEERIDDRSEHTFTEANDHDTNEQAEIVVEKRSFFKLRNKNKSSQQLPHPQNEEFHVEHPQEEMQLEEQIQQPALNGDEEYGNNVMDKENESPQQLGPIREEKPSFFSFAGKPKETPKEQVRPRSKSNRLSGFFKATKQAPHEEAPPQPRIGDMVPVDVSHLVDDEEMDEVMEQEAISVPPAPEVPAEPQKSNSLPTRKSREKKNMLSGFFSPPKPRPQPQPRMARQDSAPSFQRRDPRSRSLPPPKKRAAKPGGGLSDYFNVSPPQPQQPQPQYRPQPQSLQPEGNQAPEQLPVLEKQPLPVQPQQLEPEIEVVQPRVEEPISQQQEEDQIEESPLEPQEDVVPMDNPPATKRRPPPKSKSMGGGFASFFAPKPPKSRRPVDPPPSPPSNAERQPNPRSNSMSSLSSQKRKESKGLDRFLWGPPQRRSEPKGKPPQRPQPAAEEEVKPDSPEPVHRQPTPTKRDPSPDRIEVVSSENEFRRVPQPGRVMGRQSGRFRKQGANAARGGQEVTRPVNSNSAPRATEQSVARDLFAEAMNNRPSRRGSVTSLQKQKDDMIPPPPDSEYDQAISNLGRNDSFKQSKSHDGSRRQMTNYNSMPRLGRGGGASKQRQPPPTTTSDPETRSLGEARGRKGRKGDDCQMM